MDSREIEKNNLIARLQDLVNKTDHPEFEARNSNHYKDAFDHLKSIYEKEFGPLSEGWMDVRRERMADFNFATRRVATGAAITSEADVQALITAGVTHVIDNRGEFDDMPLLATHPEITYIYNGVPDDGQPKPTSWFQKAIEFSLDALSHPKNKVYSHCAAGVNRGPSVCYAILRAQGLDQNTAETLIRNVRPQVGLAYKNDANRAVRELGYDDTPDGSAFGEMER